MAKRIVQLNPEDVNNYGLQVEVDAAAFPESKRMSLATLLRTAPSDVVDASGLSSYTVDFGSQPVVDLTINQDTVLTLTGLNENETAILRINKAEDNIVTFNNIDGTIDAEQKNKQALTFRIGSYLGKIIAERTNTQYGFVTSLANLTPIDASIVVLNYMEYQVNYNICNFNSEFQVKLNVARNNVALEIANFPLTMLHNTQVLANSMHSTIEVLGRASLIATSASTASIVIFFDREVATTETLTVVLSGSFKIV